MARKTKTRSRPRWWTKVSWHLTFLLALSIMLYVNTLGHEYALDDAIVITDNMYTTEGVKGMSGIFSHDTFYGFFKREGKDRLVVGGRYRPLSLATFALEWQMFGKNPFVSHLVNTLLYGLLVLLVYACVMMCVREYPPLPYPELLALAVALLFATHPLHTEVVANIKGRDEILALMGSLGALTLCLRREAWAWVAGGISLLAGLFAKENAITFVAVIPLAMIFFRRMSVAHALLRSGPVLLAAGVFLLIRFSVLGWGLGEPSMELMNNPFLKIEGNNFVPFTTSERISTILLTLGKYLQLLVWPYPLTHDYYPFHISLATWSDWRVWLSLLIHLALLVVAFLGWRKRDPLTFCILYYLITLSIVSNLFFPVGTFMSERLLFMPSLAFCLAVPLLLFRFFVGKGKKQAHAPYFKVIGILGAVAAVWAFLTVVRNPAWKDNFTLFTNDIEVSENSAKLNNAVGGELLAQSMEENNEVRREEMRKRAVKHLLRAVSLHPNYKNAYLLLGNAYNYLRQYELAIAQYQKALQLDPEYMEAQNNLAITYRDAGRYYGEEKGDLRRSIEYLLLADQQMPGDYETLRLLGVAYGIGGDTPKAIRYFSEAAEAKPDQADAWLNLAKAWYNAGDVEKGNAYRQKAMELDPEVEQRN